MQSLWEGQLRRSGRLVGPQSEALPMPHEEDCTLFETAARIERHGCRPIPEAEPPQLGTIDHHVDDLAAYQIQGEFNESNGMVLPLAADAAALGSRAAIYLASHAERGNVAISTLTAAQAHWLRGAMQSKRSMPRATSPHLHPVLQIILSNVAAPALVQPAFDSTLATLLKRSALSFAHAHQIFCQLAHALHAIHEQGFFHGRVLVSSVVLREHERAPFALLGRIVGCRAVGTHAKRARSPRVAAVAAPATTRTYSDVHAEVDAHAHAPPQAHTGVQAAGEAYQQAAAHAQAGADARAYAHAQTEANAHAQTEANAHPSAGTAVEASQSAGRPVTESAPATAAASLGAGRRAADSVIGVRTSSSASASASLSAAPASASCAASSLASVSSLNASSSQTDSATSVPTPNAAALSASGAAKPDPGSSSAGASSTGSFAFAEAPAALIGSVDDVIMGSQAPIDEMETSEYELQGAGDPFGDASGYVDTATFPDPTATALTLPTPNVASSASTISSADVNVTAIVAPAAATNATTPAAAAAMAPAAAAVVPAAAPATVPNAATANLALAAAATYTDDEEEEDEHHFPHAFGDMHAMGSLEDLDAFHHAHGLAQAHLHAHAHAHAHTYPHTHAHADAHTHAHAHPHEHAHAHAAYDDDGDVRGAAHERGFEGLLAWAWATYDRLGTLTSATSEENDLFHGVHGVPSSFADAAEEASVPESYLAADVCDLGRLLLRLLLQSYKRGAHAQHAAAAAAMRPPPSSAFPPSLQRLLLSMLHPQPRHRPCMSAVLRSEWVRHPDEGTARPLCCCWRLADARMASATPSDLRLLKRPLPPFRQVNLANSPAVTDEWLEALALHHSSTLTRLDLTGCNSISSSTRPLKAIAKMQRLQLLRLPRELWAEHEIADCLAQLPHLRSIDNHILQDLLEARDALRTQCEILRNVACMHR